MICEVTPQNSVSDLESMSFARCGGEGASFEDYYLGGGSVVLMYHHRLDDRIMYASIR